MAQQALGLIETRGLVAAVAAADAAAKAAQVTVTRRLKSAGSGLVTVVYEGEVAAVRAAVDAGAEAARRIGEVVTVHVIPRAAEGLEQVTDSPATAPRRRRQTKTSKTSEDNGG